MSQRAYKHERPSTLDEAFKIIDAMDVAINSLQDQIRNLEDTDCSNCSRLEDEVSDLENKVEILDSQTTDLVKIRHAIKHGTVNDDHVYQLEKILSELDSGWMCRA